MNEREKDEYGRNLVIKKLKESGLKFTYEPTLGEFDAIDLILYVKGKPLYCEVKYRSTYKYTDFQDSILEETKLNRIMQNYSNKNGGIIYAVMWEDGILELFDLRDIKNRIESGELSLITKSMRKNNNSYERINKNVILLNHNFSIKTIL